MRSNNKWKCLVKFSGLAFRDYIWRNRFLLGKKCNIFVDVDLGKAELARKKTMLKLLFDFNATYSERVSFIRCSNGLVLNNKLFDFTSNKQIDLLKKALGKLIGQESFSPENDDS